MSACFCLTKQRHSLVENVQIFKKSTHKSWNVSLQSKFKKTGCRVSLCLSTLIIYGVFSLRPSRCYKHGYIQKEGYTEVENRVARVAVPCSYHTSINKMLPRSSWLPVKIRLHLSILLFISKTVLSGCYSPPSGAPKGFAQQSTTDPNQPKNPTKSTGFIDVKTYQNN